MLTPHNLTQRLTHLHLFQAVCRVQVWIKTHESMEQDNVLASGDSVMAYFESAGQLNYIIGW